MVRRAERLISRQCIGHVSSDHIWAHIHVCTFINISEGNKSLLN